MKIFYFIGILAILMAAAIGQDRNGPERFGRVNTQIPVLAAENTTGTPTVVFREDPNTTEHPGVNPFITDRVYLRVTLAGSAVGIPVGEGDSVEIPIPEVEFKVLLPVRMLRQLLGIKEE